jgi:hypothetical protein
MINFIELVSFLGIEAILRILINIIIFGIIFRGGILFPDKSLEKEHVNTFKDCTGENGETHALAKQLKAGRLILPSAKPLKFCGPKTWGNYLCQVQMRFKGHRPHLGASLLNYWLTWTQTGMT